jgi:hypothetical protein
MSAEVAPSPEQFNPEEELAALNLSILRATADLNQLYGAIFAGTNFANEEMMVEMSEETQKLVDIHVEFIGYAVGKIAAAAERKVALCDDAGNLLPIESVGFNGGACSFFALCGWYDETHTFMLDSHNPLILMPRGASIPHPRPAPQPARNGAYL